MPFATIRSIDANRKRVDHERLEPHEIGQKGIGTDTEEDRFSLKNVPAVPEAVSGLFFVSFVCFVVFGPYRLRI